VGAHDDHRVSLFEEHQKTYLLLQSVLLGLGQPGWALGVAAQAKARALEHRRFTSMHLPASASDPATWSIGKLQGVLKAGGVSYQHCNDQSSLVEMVVMRLRDYAGAGVRYDLEQLRGGGSDAAEIDAAAGRGAYSEVCGAWWAEVQQQARGQAAGRTLRILESRCCFATA
jgi:hypothetical protein